MMALQRDLIKHMRGHKIRGWIIFICFEVFIFYLFGNITINLLPQTLPPVVFDLITLAVVVLAVILLAPLGCKVYPAIALWQYKGAVGKEQLSKWPRNYATLLNEEGIEVNVTGTHAKGKTFFLWESTLKVTEDNERYFLYYTATEVIIIPKRTNHLSAEEKKNLLHMLNRYLNRLM